MRGEAIPQIGQQLPTEPRFGHLPGACIRRLHSQSQSSGSKEMEALSGELACVLPNPFLPGERVLEDKRKGEAGGKISVVGRCGWLNGASRGHRRQVSADVSQGSCSVSWLDHLDAAGQTGHDRA